MRKTGVLLAVAWMVGAGAVSAAGVDYTLNDLGVTNDWNDAAWSPLPGTWTSDDKAFILGGAVNWTPASHADSTTLNRVEVKATPEGTTLNITDYLRTWTGLVMNWNNTGTATINHSAGEYRLVGNVVYDSKIGGKGADNTAIYNLTGTGIAKSGGSVYIGWNSDAIMNIDGGTLDVWGSTKRIYVGYSNCVGTVNLSAGLLKQTSGRVYVGYDGSGTINQTGGKLWLNGASMIVANHAAGSGVYTISGGEIDTTIGLWVLIKDGGVFVVDGSGATSIEMSRLEVADGGVVRIKLDAGGSTVVKSSRTDAGQGLKLAGTLELDTTTGFNGAIGDTYDLFWAQTGNMEVSNMTLSVVSGIADFSLGVVSKDGGEMLQATVTSLQLDYDAWAAGWGVDIGSGTNDPDADGLPNLYEFGLAGDPTNALDQGTSPTFEVVEVGGSNVFNYVHPQRPNLTYSLALATDLVYGNWVTNAGYMVTGTNVTGGTLDFVTNAIDTVADEKFIRLIIE